MLRRGRAGSVGAPSPGPVSAARSLEALLAGNSTLAIAYDAAGPGGGGTNHARAITKGHGPSSLRYSSCGTPSGFDDDARETDKGASSVTKEATSKESIGDGDGEGLADGDAGLRRQSGGSYGSDAPTPPLPELEGSRLKGSLTSRRNSLGIGGRGRCAHARPILRACALRAVGGRRRRSIHVALSEACDG